MLGTFRIRLLLVIVIVTITGFIMQSDNRSREVVEPVLRYVLKDYGVEQRIANYIKNYRDARSETVVPASSSKNLQKPCAIVGIKKQYGWYWDSNEKKQVFYPGISLTVRENTLVRPVLPGRVAEISSSAEGRMIKIEHDTDFYSVYRGLSEVLVQKDAQVESDQVIGKNGTSLYLELRDRDGPVNPDSLFDE